MKNKLKSKFNSNVLSYGSFMILFKVKKACWHSRAPTAPVRREVRQQFIQPDPVELKIHRVDSNNAPWPVSKEVCFNDSILGYNSSKNNAKI